MTDERYLVSAAEIEQMDGQRKTHFLEPKAQCINKSLGDLTGLTRLRLSPHGGAAGTDVDRASRPLPRR